MKIFIYFTIFLLNSHVASLQAHFLDSINDAGKAFHREHEKLNAEAYRAHLEAQKSKDPKAKQKTQQGNAGLFGDFTKLEKKLKDTEANIEKDFAANEKWAKGQVSNIEKDFDADKKWVENDINSYEKQARDQYSGQRNNASSPQTKRKTYQQQFKDWEGDLEEDMGFAPSPQGGMQDQTYQQQFDNWWGKTQAEFGAYERDWKQEFTQGDQFPSSQGYPGQPYGAPPPQGGQYPQQGYGTQPYGQQPYGPQYPQNGYSWFPW